MIRRTTIELDYELLERAKRVLKCDTARATIHEALRRALDGEVSDDEPKPGSPAAVLRYLKSMDPDSDWEARRKEMWR